MPTSRIILPDASRPLDPETVARALIETLADWRAGKAGPVQQRAARLLRPEDPLFVAGRYLLGSPLLVRWAPADLLGERIREQDWDRLFTGTLAVIAAAIPTRRFLVAWPAGGWRSAFLPWCWRLEKDQAPRWRLLRHGWYGLHALFDGPLGARTGEEWMRSLRAAARRKGLRLRCLAPSPADDKLGRHIDDNGKAEEILLQLLQDEAESTRRREPLFWLDPKNGIELDAGLACDRLRALEKRLPGPLVGELPADAREPGDGLDPAEWALLALLEDRRRLAELLPRKQYLVFVAGLDALKAGELRELWSPDHYRILERDGLDHLVTRQGLEPMGRGILRRLLGGQSRFRRLGKETG